MEYCPDLEDKKLKALERASALQSQISDSVQQLPKWMLNVLTRHSDKSEVADMLDDLEDQLHSPMSSCEGSLEQESDKEPLQISQEH